MPDFITFGRVNYTSDFYEKGDRPYSFCILESHEIRQEPGFMHHPPLQSGEEKEDSHVVILLQAVQLQPEGCNRIHS